MGRIGTHRELPHEGIDRSMGRSQPGLAFSVGTTRLPVGNHVASPVVGSVTRVGMVVTVTLMSLSPMTGHLSRTAALLVDAAHNIARRAPASWIPVADVEPGWGNGSYLLNLSRLNALCHWLIYSKPQLESVKPAALGRLETSSAS
ncbi:hypothetical protein E4U58_000425 [Claviceps cyperi]|nr:hypothetical protein E4U58_000425 [Claviceps cyperi]